MALRGQGMGLRRHSTCGARASTSSGAAGRGRTPCIGSPRRARSRQEVASRGVRAFWEACNSLIVLDNERLLARVPDLPVDQAFAVMDHLVGEVIRGISDAILEQSPIHLA